jgi:hypothetical protein
MGSDVNIHMGGSMENKSSRPRIYTRLRISSAALALGALAAAAVGTGSAGATAPHATAARSLNLNDTAKLHLTDKHALVLKESGTARGSLGGQLFLQLKVTGQHNVTAQLQVYPKGGSLSGNAVANYRVTGSTASFAGAISITKGSGAYSKAKGSGLSFSGTIQRSNDAVTVHVSGKLSY